MKRILVIATRQIGDVLLTTPLIRATRERWPDARIEVLGFAGTLGMLRGNADIDHLIETPARLGREGFRQLAAGLWRRYDLVLVTQPSDRAHLLGWIASRTRSGILPATGSSNWWKRRLLTHVVVSEGDDSTTHVVAEKVALLDPWRPRGRPSLPPVVLPAATPLPPGIEAQLRPGAVAIHAPSMWPYKQWAPERFRELAAALVARGRQVVLTGSAGERDQACIAPLLDVAPPPQLLDVSGQLDFNQLATLLTRVALYIGPDTSVSHLAAASGVPTLVIFGPTNPQRWGPWPARPATRALFERSATMQSSGNVTLLQGGLPCVPCSRAGCEDHHQSRSDCLTAIAPQRVLEAALAMLGAPR